MQNIVEIGKGFYKLSSSEKDFLRNIYIRKFPIKKEGLGLLFQRFKKKNSINMIMDPGTKLDLPLLEDALKELIGGLKNIDIIFVSHQDPDVTSNVSPLLMRAKNSFLIGSIDAWRLIKMYGVPQGRFKAAESFVSSYFEIPGTTSKIYFVPATYCHFRGAMMVYDPETRILFSGDFMAGLNTMNKQSVYADESAWPGIALFHQIYMPSKKAIQRTIELIRMLTPKVEVIAPQHGYVIKGDLVDEFLERLYHLDVGVDIEDVNNAYTGRLVLALSEFLSKVKVYNIIVHTKLLKLLKESQSREFTQPIVFMGEEVSKINIGYEEAVEYIVSVIRRNFKKEANELLIILQDILVDLSLPIPPFLSNLLRKDLEENAFKGE